MTHRFIRLFAAKAAFVTLILLVHVTGRAQTERASQIEQDRDRIIGAIAAGDLKALKLALSRSNAVNEGDASGETPLISAAAKGSAQMTQMILDNGGDPNIRDRWTKYNALLAAARAGCVECMREILKRGGDAKAVDFAGATLLMVAASSGNPEAVRFTARKETVNRVDRYGRSALDYAVRARSAEAVKLLLSLHERTEQADKNGWTPLHVAALMDTPDIAELLIRAGAHVDAESTSGETPLLLAARALSPQVIGVLLRAGANANKTAGRGRDALMQACDWQYDCDVKPSDGMEREVADVVRVLVPRSNLVAKDADGKTALELATKNGHRLAADLILVASRGN